jgi:lysozyme
VTRQIVAAGLDLIKRNEGLRLTAYRDIAGIPTIGFGHCPATMGQTITEDEATALLQADLAWAENAVELATQGIPTTDNQFSAMVSLTFNIGIGFFRTSTVLRKHRAEDYAGAAAAFLLWNKAHVDGELVVVQGLLRRRREESELYQAA